MQATLHYYREYEILYHVQCLGWVRSRIRMPGSGYRCGLVAILTSLVLAIRYLLLLLQGECMHVAVWSLIPCCRPKIMCGRP